MQIAIQIALFILVCAPSALAMDSRGTKRSAQEAALEERADEPKHARTEHTPPSTAENRTQYQWPRRTNPINPESSELIELQSPQEEKIASETKTITLRPQTLAKAISQNNAACVNEFIEQGQEVETNAFSLVSENCSPSIVAMLCAQGADPNIHCYESDKIIHIFAAKNNDAAIKALISSRGIYHKKNNPQGIKINAKNTDGLRAIDIAMSENHPETVATLFEQPGIEMAHDLPVAEQAELASQENTLNSKRVHAIVQGNFINDRGVLRYGSLPHLLRAREIGGLKSWRNSYSTKPISQAKTQ